MQQTQEAYERTAALDAHAAGWPSLQDDGHTCGPECGRELGIAPSHWTELPFAPSLGEA